MHITDKEAGQVSPPRPRPPLQQPQRSADAQFVTYRLLILEFDNWMSTHVMDAAHRIELEFRLSTMKSLYAPYFKLLIEQAGFGYFELTKDFRDRYYMVIARGEMILRGDGDPQND